jgi:hypothetical protein
MGINAKGIEINPPTLRIVDNANLYHLWEQTQGETVGISLKKGLGKNFVLLILRRTASK